MFKIKAYAGPNRGNPSTNRTADDRAYTAWAERAAAEAGYANPTRTVANNVRANAPATQRRRVGPRNRGGNL